MPRQLQPRRTAVVGVGDGQAQRIGRVWPLHVFVLLALIGLELV